VIIVQLESPAVLRQLQSQNMTESQRQAVAEVLVDALSEAAAEAVADPSLFDPALFAR